MIRFFVCNDILSLIDDKTKENNILIKTITPENAKPFFIYVYSIFESTITEILRYYLKAFPEKLDKPFNISKDDLLSATSVDDIIVKHVNSNIRCFSSESLYQYLSFFDKTLSLDTEIDINLINNISSMRNSIIHDNAKSELMSKHIYNLSESKFSVSEMHNYMLMLNNYLLKFKVQIKNKYEKYTLEKLLRNIWKNIFSSPLLTFERIWKINEKGILQIQDLELIKTNVQGLSSSEHLLLAVFLQQYSNNLNSQLHSFQDLPALVSLDSETKDKLVQIISFFKSYPLLFNGEKIQ